MNCSGGLHEEAGLFEAWTFSVALKYMGGMDCGKGASGEAVRPERSHT